MNSKATKYLELLLSKMDGGQINFMKALINKDFESCKKIALELYKKHPSYLLFFCLLKKDENRQMLLSLLKKASSLDPHTVYSILCSDVFNYEEIKGLCESYKSTSFIHICIRKKLFLKKYQSKQIDENTEREIDTLQKEELESLIQQINDFELYDLAIRNKVQLNPRNTLNYDWYILLRDHSTEVAKKLILKSTNFQEIQRILTYSGIFEIEDEKYSILIDYLIKGYSYCLLKRSFEVFEKDKSFLSIKLVLSLLIASKDEKLLVLALFISKNYTQPDNYEILLIHLFLNRYFLILKQLNDTLSKLEIKNIQHHNMAYIWSDPMIILNAKLTHNITCFMNEMTTEIDGLKEMTRKFIENNLVSHAVSSFNLYCSLNDSVIYKEIKSMSILADQPSTLFSDLLGDECRYIFDKITTNDKKTVHGSINTIRSIAANQFENTIFRNEFMSISDDDFIKNFQSSIIKKS